LIPPAQLATVPQAFVKARRRLRRTKRLTAVWFAISLYAATPAHAQSTRWTESAAADWYNQQPWLVGSDYIPATAINELEMWQAATFDPRRIDLELGWAESLGLNTMRVFLHDLLWKQDPEGFKKRIDTFLTIAQKHHIRPVLVLFDSCWDPSPKLGKQHAPTPGIHNSGWVQSPGATALSDPAEYPRLKAYVTGVVSAFAKDQRVLAWDIWNEPDNRNQGSYEKQEPPNKVEIVLSLLPRAFDWSRSANPSQPLTSGVWDGDWWPLEKVSSMAMLQLELSDVVSFHSYEKPEIFEQRVLSLQHYRRPIICTEYMARGNGSTFQGTLPIARKYRVAAINWGLVAGKTQTYLPWDSWQKPYTDRQPTVWHHEIFHTTGQPYREDETAFIRSIIRGESAAGFAAAQAHSASN
jgi:hypothetical protein